MATALSDYEAKRLRRIEENRQKLQSLDLPVVEEQKLRATAKKRKREPQEPTRKSSRMRKKRKLEKAQRRKAKELRKLVKAEKNLRKLEKQKRREERELRKKEKMARKRCKLQAQLENKKNKHQRKLAERVKKKEEQEEERQKRRREKKEKKQREVDVEVQEKMMELFGPPLQTQPRISDWRLRRKLMKQEEQRRESMRKRIEKREQRLQEKIKEKKRKLWKRELAKRERRTARVKRELARKEEMENRRLARDKMRRQKRMAREFARYKEMQEKRKRLEARYAAEDKETWGLVFKRSKRLRQEARAEHEELYRQRYPVFKCEALPFVQMSGTVQPTARKPLVATPLLRIDTTLFHSFSLGKQFLPPGKESVMQALCPGGYTPLFAEDSDIHIWKNGMALFVPCTSGMYMEYLFREARLGKKKHILFPWRRTREVTPFHLWHLSQVQRGEEAIRCSDNYYLAPFPRGKPLPLLLFVQYPNGPYVYFGRLGYLGYKMAPDIEFSFQLLDIDTLNWRKMRRLFVAADEDRVWPEVEDEEDEIHDEGEDELEEEDEIDDEDEMDMDMDNEDDEEEEVRDDEDKEEEVEEEEDVRDGEDDEDVTDDEDE